MWDSAEAMHKTQIFSELKLLGVTRVRLLPPRSLHCSLITYLCFFGSPHHHPHLHFPLSRATHQLSHDKDRVRKVPITNLEVQSGVTSRVVQLRRVCEAKLQLNEDRKPYVTDNSNYIVELHFKTPIKDACCRKKISPLEGVVDRDLFLDMATAEIISIKTSVDVKAK
ncbi:uncharacterized protein LOC104432788 [Eucalyptus grandis]|uniref:uncharacterized protein LOC104432788 n=1 Tax=Eucalyptus grandis TaxID=71139 RepID=UPI00192F099C|nr:uncharacterized protein LOC104432788 [Eucalyptus grandis]